MIQSGFISSLPPLGFARLWLRLRETFSNLAHLLLHEASSRGSFSIEVATQHILAFKQGDPQAFEALVALIQRDLWNFLVNQRLQIADAEDLFQDILMKLYQKLNQLQQPQKFRSWLFAIALNELRARFRKQPMQSFEQLQDAGFMPESEQPDAQRDLASKQHLLALRRCLQALPERERSIFLLDRFAGLQQAELADLFELNLNTVKTILRRTRIQIVKAMQEAGHV